MGFGEGFRLQTDGGDITSISFMTSSAILAVATSAGYIHLIAKGDDAEWYESNCVRFSAVEVVDLSLIRFVHSKGNKEYDNVSSWAPTCKVLARLSIFLHGGGPRNSKM